MKTLEENDGIYVAYFTAEFGTSLGIFLIKDGNICGADVASGLYDGRLELTNDGKFLRGNIEFKSNSEGMTTITGASSDMPVMYSTEVELEIPIEARSFHEIMTQTGPVNVRFQKIRELR